MGEKVEIVSKPYLSLQVVVEANEEESILFGELVFEKIKEVRKGIPVFADRRPELYK